MKEYTVIAEITVSLYAKVLAKSKQEAMAKAEDTLCVPSIKELDEDSDECWHTSGELDGEPCVVGVEP